jgi:hypothetical protein
VCTIQNRGYRKPNTAVGISIYQFRTAGTRGSIIRSPKFGKLLLAYMKSYFRNIKLHLPIIFIICLSEFVVNVENSFLINI